MRPARQVVTRSPYRSVGFVAAPWLLDEPVPHESEHEKAFLEVVLCCPVIQKVAAQPFCLTYLVDGRERKHIPDYLVTFKRGRSGVVEVKPARFVDEHRAKFDHVSPLLSARGLPYFVVSHLAPNSADVEQAALWRRYARVDISPAMVIRAQAMVIEAGSLTLAELESRGIPVAAIYHLLGRGQLISADRFSLTPETRLLAFMYEESLDECVYFEHWIGCPPWRPDLASGTPPG